MLTYVEKDINRLTQHGFEYEIKLFYTLNASLFCSLYLNSTEILDEIPVFNELKR